MTQNAIEKLLRSTIDSSMDMIQVFKAVRNEQGLIIDFVWILNNKASEAIYGDVIGKSLLTLNPGVIEEGIFDTFKKVVETGLPDQSIRHYVHEQFDGWFHQSTVKQDDGVATTTRDITDIKRSKQEIENARTSLQNIIDNSMDIIQVFEAVRNETGNIIDFIWTIQNTRGYTQNGDVVGKRLLHYNPGVIKAGLFEKFVKVTETGIPIDHEVQYQHEQFNGWFRQRLVKMGDGFVMNTEDITERKIAEIELKASKELVSTVFDVSLNPIAYHKAIRDASGRIVDLEFLLENRVARTYAIKDRTGQRYSVAYPGITDTVVFKMYCDVVETGQELNTEVQLDLKGIFRWFHLMAAKFGDGLVATAVDITDRKKAEEENLRLKEKIAQKVTDKYYAIFNSIDEGFCIYELIYDETGKPVDLKWLEVNPAYEKQTGLKDVVGKRHSELSLATEQYWFDIYDKVVKSGDAIRFENWHEPAGRWYNSYSSRVGGEDNYQVAVIFYDITQRKQHEQHQQFLLTFSDALRSEPDINTIEETGLGLIADFLRLDRAYIFVLYPSEDRAVIRAEKRNEQFVSLVGEVRMSDFPETVRQIEYETLVVYDIDSDVRLSDLNRKSLDAVNLQAFVCASVRKGEKNVICSLAAATTTPRTWTDSEIELIEIVAERIWAAVERAKAEEALRDSDKRFQSIANLVPDLLWDSEPDGSTNWYNQRWLEYTGQSFEQAIGWSWTDTIHPEDKAGSAKRYAEAVAAGSSLRQEHRIRRHDGEYRWFVVNATPLKDEHGRVVKMYGTATDIHDSKQVENALRESETELKNLLQLRDDFIGIASHELNTPVTSIKMYAEIITDKMEQSGETSNIDLLSKLNTQIDRLYLLISTLLDTTRIAEGKLQLSPEKMEISELIQERAEEIGRISDHQIELRLQTLPAVVADRERIGQVITNFLSNAIKYSPSATVITVAAIVEAGFIKVSVKDRGYGIPEEDLPKVFERFYRVTANKMDTYPGLGLGLYISAQIIERHGGTISVQSKLGSGSTFSFTLPLSL